MNFLGIIPARFASSRFPGKPLADIAGKTMIHRVYLQASKALEKIVVATDDQGIFDEVKSFGGNVVFTSTNHNTGTERCLEALDIFSEQENTFFDIIVNIQGDEPLISPEAIKNLISVFSDSEVDIATLINKKSFSEELLNPNLVKVIKNNKNFAQYFSRNLIPYIRNYEDKNKLNFYTHVGIYAYRNQILKQISALKKTNSEIAEKLEQNRWLENAYSIKTIVSDYFSIGVDTPEDLEKIIKQF